MFSEIWRQTMARGDGGYDPLMYDPVVGPRRKRLEQGMRVETDYIVSVGLGHANGPADLVAVVRYNSKPATYLVKQAQHWEADTPYTLMAQQAGKILRVPPLHTAAFVVDDGLGADITKLFRAEKGTCSWFPVLVTSAQAEVEHNVQTGLRKVPAWQVASAVLSVMQGRRISFENFGWQVSLREGLRQFGKEAGVMDTIRAVIFRARPQGTLVLAVALALWLGENSFYRFWVK